MDGNRAVNDPTVGGTKKENEKEEKKKREMRRKKGEEKKRKEKKHCRVSIVTPLRKDCRDAREIAFESNFFSPRSQTVRTGSLI